MLPGSIPSCACFCVLCLCWLEKSFIIVLSNESQVAQMLDYLPQYTPLSPSKFHAQTLPLLSSPHLNPSPFPVSLDTDIDQEIC